MKKKRMIYMKILKKRGGGSREKGGGGNEIHAPCACGFTITLNIRPVKFFPRADSMPTITYIYLVKEQIYVKHTCRNPELYTKYIYSVCRSVNFVVSMTIGRHVCFVDRCLSFCTFYFGHCIVCSSIYGI